MQIPAALDPAEALSQNLPGVLIEARRFRDELTLVVAPADVVRTAQFLRDTRGLVFNYLSDISAVDYYEPTLGYGDYGSRPARFGVSYHLFSMLYASRVRVKVFVPEDALVVPTLTNLWPGANWLEREIYDMFGIRFDGHPMMRRVLMPEDWEGHPARRDYPLGYETVMFSFNVDEITRQKPKADN